MSFLKDLFGKRSKAQQLRSPPASTISKTTNVKRKATTRKKTTTRKTTTGKKPAAKKKAAATRKRVVTVGGKRITLSWSA